MAQAEQDSGRDASRGRRDVSNPEEDAATISTQLSYERTALSILRSYMSAERTLMSWIRTTLSMISFTLAKLGQAVHEVEVKRLLGGVEIVGVRRIVQELHKLGLTRRFSISAIVAVVPILLGAFAFTSLVGNF